MSVSSWIRRQFNNAVSVVDYVPAGFSNVAATFTAHDGSSFPDGSVGPFIVTVDQNLATEERILCSSRSGSLFTVAPSGRGYNGYTPQAHGPNASLLHTTDKQDLDEANQVAVQTLGAVQASGDLLVGASANTLQRLARGTTNQFLQTVGTALQWTSFGISQSQAVGAANLDGTQTTPARSDHAHAGVTSFNTRQGGVTFTVGDAESVFTAAGQILVGTGSGTGALLAGGTTGQVLSAVTGAAPVWSYPALSDAAGHLSADYTTTGSLATFLSTASLAAGTWLVTLSGTCEVGLIGGGGTTGIEAVVGSGSATLEGALSTECRGTTAADGTVPFTLSFRAVVTVAAVINFQAIVSGASKIHATTPANSYANATGYVAVRYK